MKTRHVRWMALLLLLGTSGCIVEESIGPQGPPGNANVFTLNFLFTMREAAFNGSVASVQYDVPDLTRSVVENGAVLLFFRDQGTWTAMPYTFGVESPDLPAVDYTVSMGFGYEVGFLEVFYEASNETVALERLPDREMKAVVIDGWYYGKKGADLTDWETVKALFDLED